MTETKVERSRVEALAEAEANRTRLAGQAEAEVALTKGKAEAEARQKTTNAFKEHGEAIVLSMAIDILPQLTYKAAQPLRNVEKTSVVDTGDGSGEANGANRVTNYATNLLPSTQGTLKATAGFDLKEIVRNLPTRGIISQTNMYETPKEAEQNSIKEE